MPLRGWRVALVIWMGLIFLGSSGLLASRMSSESTVEVFGWLNYFFRKLGHVSEYGLLTYLWLRSMQPVPERFGRSLAWSAGLAVLYAMTDEIHQSYVPQRTGVWSDVVIDAMGALAVAYALWRIRQDGSPALRRWILGEGRAPGGPR